MFPLLGKITLRAREGSLCIDRLHLSLLPVWKKKDTAAFISERTAAMKKITATRLLLKRLSQLFK
ncbi:MAG TPA: hypothetical protein VF490_05790 [Chryseosolibacter sp.]